MTYKRDGSSTSRSVLRISSGPRSVMRPRQDSHRGVDESIVVRVGAIAIVAELMLLILRPLVRRVHSGVITSVGQAHGETIFFVPDATALVHLDVNIIVDILGLLIVEFPGPLLLQRGPRLRPILRRVHAGVITRVGRVHGGIIFLVSDSTVLVHADVTIVVAIWGTSCPCTGHSAAE